MPRFFVFVVTLLVHTVTAVCRSRAEIVALPRVGGLRHRYEWRDAA